MERSGSLDENWDIGDGDTESNNNIPESQCENDKTNVLEVVTSQITSSVQEDLKESSFKKSLSFEPGTREHCQNDSEVVDKHIPSTSTSPEHMAGTNSDISSQKTTDNPRISISVTQPSKLQKEESKKEVDLGGPSKMMVIFKWVVTMLMCLVCCSCIVLSKVSIMGLAVTLYNTNTNGQPYRAYSMILLILLVPNAFNLLRAMWMSLLRKDMPWPSRKSVIYLIGVSLLESFGVCLFAYKVLAQYHVLGILATTCVFLVPIGCCIKQHQRQETNGTFSKTLLIVSLFLVLIGAAFTIYGSTLSSTGMTWHLPVAILSLTLCWNPFVQENLIIPKRTLYQEETNFGLSATDDSPTESESADMDNSNNDSGYFVPLSTFVDIKTIEERANVQSCWKSTIILCLARIPCIIVFSIILYFVDNNNINSMSAAWESFKDSWNWSISDTDTKLFITNVSASLIGYLMALSACRVCIQRGGFVVPIILALGLSVFLVWDAYDLCSSYLFENVCGEKAVESWVVSISAISLFLGVFLSYGQTLWVSETMILHSESELFWLPAYSGVLLEEWLFIGRRNKRIERGHFEARDLIKKTKVYICTTMYRETRDEMKQLLESIGRINQAQASGDRYFESHIFFDGGVKDKTPTDFALQLISLLPSTLGIDSIETCTKSVTPYGMSLTWRLPFYGGGKYRHGRSGILFMIHLKDNRKVKNKKRWSQIMYMSYVLDFLVCQSVDKIGNRQVVDNDAFILTTDADVKFTPSSVEALLDLMTRDKTVGAVCARTHPLGSGPLVWYQVFEYAIGHWFQKAAEHVLGSVLCAPGCFSVYRVKAVRDIVTTYASNVDKAFDFLIKDMGEDRWFCTLMVQSGWRIEYCATSENSTQCPEEFEEFYKQRRRWIASTIANLMLLMKEWRIISRYNHRVSFLFTVYQGLLLMSTLIGPSVIILVVSGGLLYGWNVNVITTIILQALVCVLFVLVCLFTSESKQMMTAKILTFIYACVMMAVAVGTAQQIVLDIGNEQTSSSVNGTDTSPTINPSDISRSFQFSLTTVYFGGIVGIFFTAGLFHPREFFCLAHGIWYLLCLPSGYLVLNIYSIANITDRSWGTREEKERSVVKDTRPWYERAKDILIKLCFCFDSKEKDKDITTTPHPHQGRTHTSSLSEPGHHLQRSPSLSDSVRKLSSSKEDMLDEVDAGKPKFGSTSEGGREDEFFPDEDVPIPVEDWLDRELRDDYVELFKRHGFDNTMFISGMNRKDLINIGIKKKAHITWLLEQIDVLPGFYIETKVPDNVFDWLNEIGLSNYYRNFKDNKITNAKELETLKSFSRKEIEKELKITKAGHVKRLLNAIKHLRKPTEEEQERNKVKKDLENAITHRLENTNKEEVEFWEALIEVCLQPSSDAFGHQEELKVKLAELRNNFLLILAISNTLWLILLATLATKADLKVSGTDPVGLIFLSIFGFIFVLQYLSMFVHRLMTLGHFCARAPYKFHQSYATTWSFTDKKSDFDVSTDEDYLAVRYAREGEIQGRARLKYGTRSRSRKLSQRDPENIPLLRSQEFTGHPTYNRHDV